MSGIYGAALGAGVQLFMVDLSRADSRGFIRDCLKGQLFGALFNKEGDLLPDITMARRTARTSQRH